MLIIEGNHTPEDCSNCPYSFLGPNEYEICGLGAQTRLHRGKPLDCPIVDKLLDSHEKEEYYMIYSDETLQSGYGRYASLEDARKHVSQRDQVIVHVVELKEIAEKVKSPLEYTRLQTI